MRENYTLPRLHLSDVLRAEAEIDLPREAAHFLTTVIRRREGDSLRVFNTKNGEWRAEITQIAKRNAQLMVREQLRQPYAPPQLTLMFAPVRKHRTAFIFEKGTELGVTQFLPVLTTRTQFPRLNLDKAKAQTIEAAEQTERLDVPEIAALRPLMDVLSDWSGGPILFADEAETAQPARSVCMNLTEPPTLLIGPEGGFSPEEREELRAMPCVQPLTLGPRILRADTAAIALLSVWQSVGGDW